MNHEHQTNLLTRLFSVWRIAVALVLIALVVTKPVISLVLDNLENKTELSSIDSDQEEDQEDSEEEGSEEDQVENLFIAPPQFETFSSSSRINKIDYQQKHSSDYRIGIVVPPPELV